MYSFNNNNHMVVITENVSLLCQKVCQCLRGKTISMVIYNAIGWVGNAYLCELFFIYFYIKTWKSRLIKELVADSAKTTLLCI